MSFTWHCGTKFRCLFLFVLQKFFFKEHMLSWNRLLSCHKLTFIQHYYKLYLNIVRMETPRMFVHVLAQVCMLENETRSIIIQALDLFFPKFFFYFYERCSGLEISYSQSNIIGQTEPFPTLNLKTIFQFHRLKIWSINRSPHAVFFSTCSKARKSRLIDISASPQRLSWIEMCPTDTADQLHGSR